MTTIGDETGALIARRVRLERETRGWSQTDLAQHAGVSKATVSKIEREEMSPTAVLLVKLAAAFDLTLAGLLLRAERDAGRVSRVAGQPTWRDPDTGYLRTQVFAQPDHPVELVTVDLPPHRRVTLPAASYAHIRQVVWVRRGTLTLLEGGTSTALHAGDALGFGAPTDVTFANDTDEPCGYVVALART